MLDFIELGLNIKHKIKNIHQQHTQETNNYMHSGRQTKPLTLFNEFYDKCNEPAYIYSPAAEHHRTEVHFPSALGGRLSSLGTIPSFLVMRTHYTLNNSLSDPYKGHIIKGHGHQTSCIGSGNSAGDKLSPKTRGVARSLDDS